MLAVIDKMIAEVSESSDFAVWEERSSGGSTPVENLPEMFRWPGSRRCEFQ